MPNKPVPEEVQDIVKKLANEKNVSIGFIKDVTGLSRPTIRKYANEEGKEEE